jgi:nucleotide-binding universal stress UspA family protein
MSAATPATSTPRSRTIVVGVDGSAHAARALAWAIDEASRRDARLRVVAAWHVPLGAYGLGGLVPPVGAAVDDSFREVAEGVAAVAAETARAAGAEAEVRVAQGQAADVLIDAAADADLLVVGSRGHGGFAGLMLGSVSTQCAHHARCPVVIVRAGAGEAA